MARRNGPRREHRHPGVNRAAFQPDEMRQVRRAQETETAIHAAVTGRIGAAVFRFAAIVPARPGIHRMVGAGLALFRRHIADASLQGLGAEGQDQDENQVFHVAQLMPVRCNRQQNRGLVQAWCVSPRTHTWVLRTVS